MAKRARVRRGFKGVRSIAGMLLLLAGAGGPAGMARGQTYTWVPLTGPTWDTTSPYWSGAGTRWTNSTASVAVFPAFAGGGTSLLSLGQNILAHSVQFDGGYAVWANGHTLTLAGSGAGVTLTSDATLEPPIAGTDGLNVNLLGASLYLTGASTYSGPTVVQGSGGQLQLAGNAGPNRLPINSNLTLGSGTTLHMYGSAVEQVGALTGSGTVEGEPASFAVSGGSSAAFFQGILQDAHSGILSVSKVGTGTQVFMSPSSYTGGTHIQGGTLIMLDTNAVGTGAVQVDSGATLAISTGITPSVACTLAGSGSFARGGALASLAGNNTFVGTITPSADFAISAVSGSLTIPSPISTGSYALTLNPMTGASITLPTIYTSAPVVKNGAGTLTLLNASGLPSVGNGLTINAGSVVLAHQASLSGVAVNIAPGGSLLAGASVSPSIRALSGGDSSSRVAGSGGVPVVMTLNTTVGDWAFAGVIADGPVAAGLGITKTGFGNQYLLGNSTYTGPTTVAQGSLTVNAGASLGATPITITGGTLSGNGALGGTVTLNSGVLTGTRTISGLVTMNGGTIHPGSGQGTLTLANGLTLTGGTIEIQGPNPIIGYSQIAVTGGNVDLGSGVAAFSISTSGNPLYGSGAIMPIIVNHGPGTTTGFFAGLPERAEVPSMAGFGGQAHWYIYYHANTTYGLFSTGNDVALSPTANPPLIANGSFELGTALGTLQPGSANIAGWTITRGSVDWTDTGTWQAADGARTVDLQGVNASGGVEQTVSLLTGHRYRLTFALAGNTANLPFVKHMSARADATIANFTFDIRGHTLFSMGYQDQSMVFYAASPSVQIELYSTDPAGSWGAVVDNVRLVEAPCAVDFNRDGPVTVQDIFDFLTAWFAGDSRTDFNHSGGLSVQDIFDFLAAWFGGCP